MADVKRKAVNKFTKGLVMDFSPENTQNELLTHALNATLLTFNGNELSLQNDMGNARVETAFLPEGYIPVGTCEYGGIIYIVSYNPIEDKSQIGCFPSPERTVSNEELGEFNKYIENSDFQNENGELKNTTQCVLLRNDSLNPGDKFIVTANETVYGEALQDLFIDNNPVKNPRIALNIVSIEDSGRIVYLNSSIRDYTKEHYTYHILGSLEGEFAGDSKLDLDDYRSNISSGYSVFKSKTSGKLAILAELVMIDSYSVTHSVVKTDEPGVFDVIIHTEVEPGVSENNYDIVPKLKYYYLEKSQGYLQRFNDDGEFKAELFPSESSLPILNTSLDAIYETTTGEDLKLDKVILNSENFDFPASDTYHAPEDALFIPNINTNYEYPDVKLATFKVPEIILEKSLPDLPFKYDYTLVPCMDYGKLEHLAVSNTVDFSKLHDFNKSNFNTWKYHIDGNQLRLTFGADVFDTFESDKVSGLVLEFYDLWGFAGSLEISNKKSYSGVYTKIIPLNTLNALSKSKITSEGVLSDYVHNINIIHKEKEFYYNNLQVTHDELLGWRYDGVAIDNDCGTLYSNVLYGVKSYFKVTNSSGVNTYIQKKDFFLFTIPIYNDLYYTISDFSTLEYPKLSMLLTYKIEDNSTTTNYEGSGFTNGYIESDYANVIKYKEGNYPEQQFSVTKHVVYKGTSKLYLEIGLKPEYNSLNVYHDPDLNNYFYCTLQLVGNTSDENYLEIKSEVSSENVYELLGYAYNFENDANILKFKSGSTITFNEGIRSFNFLNPALSSPGYIELEYKFMVGYKISVEDIKNSQIPATTFCALYHQDARGNYNTEDFGIYIQQDEAGETLYYSNSVFYNSGTANESIFGVGKQVNHVGTLEEQVQIIDYTKTATEPITTLGQFNAGEPLHYLTDHIGKLTFCQPHVHGLGDANTTNIQKDLSGVYFIQNPSLDKNYKNPALYNLSLNTKSVINYNTEFISSIDHATVNDSNGVLRRKYTGITGDKLSNFNKCLLNTMSSVYAYNPDYGTMDIKVGNPYVVDNRIQFTSNIISKDAAFKFKAGETLNNYIYIGNVKFSDYLAKLTTYSGIATTSHDTVLPQLLLHPDCTYCGESPNAYLLSSLTYKTEVPADLISDLTFSKSDLTVVKHSDGSVKVINGSPNKKALYGWNNGILIGLDVSTYSIQDSGDLDVSPPTGEIVEEFVCNQPITQSDYDLMSFYNLQGDALQTSQVIVDLVGNRIKNAKIKLSTVLKHNASKCWVTKDSIIFAISKNNQPLKVWFEGSGFYTEGGLKPPMIGSPSFSTIVNSKIIDGNKMTIFANSNSYSLENQSIETIQALVKSSHLNKPIKFKKSDGSITSIVPKYFWLNANSYEYDIVGGNTPMAMSLETFNAQTSLGSNLDIILVELKISKVVRNIVWSNLIDETKCPVLEVMSTPIKEYVERAPWSNYVIKENYKDRTLVGTSITLNDLVYEPSISGHRLFMKKSNYWLGCFGDLAGDIYYRGIDEEEISDETKNLNKLSFYTGPCFI